jgi:hypothetical protein
VIGFLRHPAAAKAHHSWLEFSFEKQNAKLDSR